MRLSGVKELRQLPYCLSPLQMIFFSQETTFGGCNGLLGFSAVRKRFVSMRSHTANRSSAAGETSDGPPTIE